MNFTRNGFYRIKGPDGYHLLNENGDIRQCNSRDECYEHVSEDPRAGDFIITCPDRTVKKKVELTA